MPNSQRYTVTAALLYANGPAHIGHLAGCYIPADVYVRFLRSSGHEVLFVTGSDEHGVPITIKAQKEGLTPQQVVDKYHKQIKETFEQFGISPDIYSRTSNPLHHQTAQDFFNVLYTKKAFTEIASEQYYDPKAETFLADRYIIGTCPVCGNDKAYGDQCEKCGSTLSPDELINPHSALSGEAPIKKTTTNWYLPLDSIQQSFLNSYVAAHKQWKPNVFGQCNSWLQEGLKPRAMTRDLDWGIKLPLPNTEGKVLYVWFDAPIGYISMARELFEKNTDTHYLKQHNIGIYPSALKLLKNNRFEDFWSPTSNTKLVHFIGKDNIVFHCLIFPAMCHAHGGYKIADEVPANEFLNLEGDKISTSRNWAVWAHEYLIDFPGKQDVLRYFLTANAPESKDNNFTWNDFQTANNSELVGILGNFVNRTFVLTAKGFNNIVPGFQANHLNTSLLQKINTLSEQLIAYQTQLTEYLHQYKFRDALSTLMDIARMGNKFLAETEPWKIKDDSNAVAAILYSAIQITANLSVLMEPFMPFTAQKLASMLQLETKTWHDCSFNMLPSGHALGAASLLFEKIEDADIEKQRTKLQLTKASMESTLPKSDPNAVTAKVTDTKSNITYDQFSALDIRVGTIIAAEKVEKADKLLKLQVNIGSEERTIVSGIALHYLPEAVVGKQVSVLTNLEPRKLRGIESQGMILMAEDQEGKLVFVLPEQITPNGSEIR